MLKVTHIAQHPAGDPPPRHRRVEKTIGAGVKVGRVQRATPTVEEAKMTTTTHAVSPWHWGTTTPPRVVRENKLGREELWAGAVYLMVWSVLWLAVLVTVLSPLDVLFGGGR
jgi:hypothetical protein